VVPVIGLSLLAGCGALGDLSATAARAAAELPGSADAAVVLTWSGGESTLYPGRTFEPIDLSLFETNRGTTLADHEATFKELVRLRVEQTLASFASAPLRVLNDETGGLRVETTVCLTQDLSPEGRVEIGRGKYDPCDRHTEDSAVVFGEQIRRLGNGYSLEEWVTLFANVCTHETAHTFGYGHVSRSDRGENARGAYVELMLEAHTMTEMRKPQLMLSGLTACDDHPTPSDSVAATSAGK
jgi:hypothetical protein